MIYGYFDDPYAFEACAARLWAMLTPGTDYDITRRMRDGGRDAIGQLRIGPLADAIKLDFALEAKRYALRTGVGVEEMSRLISRLRHRQFGVLVTTSYVTPQVYQEIRADEHPVVVVAARDIVAILRRHDLGTLDQLRTWLEVEFPKVSERPVITEPLPAVFDQVAVAEESERYRADEVTSPGENDINKIVDGNG